MNTFINVSVLSFILISFSAKAEANPSDWNMSCARWQERAHEILQDESLGTEKNRYWLVSHLRTKVSEECITPDQL